jgi:ribonuclease VapC
MMAVDTSALMAVVLDEPEASACIAALATKTPIFMSAVTLAEALIVAGRRNVGVEMTAIVDGLGIEVVPVTAFSARRVAAIYERWGRGFHAAALNFGDCFAYETAEARDCPLLFVGTDFRKTDVRSVL